MDILTFDKYHHSTEVKELLLIIHAKKSGNLPERVWGSNTEEWFSTVNVQGLYVLHLWEYEGSVNDEHGFDRECLKLDIVMWRSDRHGFFYLSSIKLRPDPELFLHPDSY